MYIIYIKTIRCEKVGPRTHFKSRLSLIVRAKVVLITDLIGQLRRDVIGRLSQLSHDVIGYEDS